MRAFVILCALGCCPITFAQQFEEVAARAGVDFKHNAQKTPEKLLPEAMGSGVAVLDYDGDGRLDVYFIDGAPGGSRLYRNLGDWRFRDTTDSAGVAGDGVGMGVAVGDLDNDGDPDLFVSNVGADRLYRNDGEGGFEEVGEAAGVAGEGWSSGAAFLDFDRDGLLDLFVARYLDWNESKSRPCGSFLPERRSYCHPRLFGAVTHRLYRNLGDGRFEDVSEAAGLDEHPGKGLGVALGDYDQDGWIDVFVANDSYPQQLFRNVEGKRVEEIGVAAGAAYDADGRDYAGMGAVWADADRDGAADLLVNALGRQGYWLYRRDELGFQPISEGSGLAALSELRSGWGMGLVDFDNDGWRDLLVAQGHVMDDIADTDPALAHREPLMLARGLFGRFYDAARRGGEVFRRRVAGRGVAFGDLDQDGRVDAVVNVNDGPALVLRNVTAEAGRSLTLRLEGTTDNRDAVGARVTVRASGGLEQTGFASTAGSYLSSSSLDLHFGLGEAECCELVEIVWPNGSSQSVAVVGDGLATIRQRD